MLFQPLAIEQLGHVADAGVAENGDDHLSGTTLAREADRAGKIDARGQSDKQAFFAQQVMDNSQRRLIGNAIGFVDRNVFKFSSPAPNQCLRHKNRRPWSPDFRCLNQDHMPAP